MPLTSTLIAFLTSQTFPPRLSVVSNYAGEFAVVVDNQILEKPLFLAARLKSGRLLKVLQLQPETHGSQIWAEYGGIKIVKASSKIVILYPVYDMYSSHQLIDLEPGPNIFSLPDNLNVVGSRRVVVLGSTIYGVFNGEIDASGRPNPILYSFGKGGFKHGRIPARDYFNIKRLTHNSFRLYPLGPKSGVTIDVRLPFYMKDGAWLIGSLESKVD